MQTQEIDEETLAKLAQDPGNLVCRYVDTHSEGEQPSLEQLRKLVVELYEAVHAQHPRDASHAKRIVERLKQDDQRWLRLSKSNPQFFEKTTRFGTGPQELAAILECIRIKERQQSGELTQQEGSDEYNTYLWNTFKMSEAEYKARHPSAPIRQASSLSGSR